MQHEPKICAQQDLRLPTVVYASVGSLTLEALVDTGSSLTVINEDTLKLTYPDAYKRMRHGTLTCTKSADGSLVPSAGIAGVPIKIGSQTVHFPLYVAKSLFLPLILGVDFLSYTKGAVDIYKQILLMNDVKVCRLYVDIDPPVDQTSHEAIISTNVVRPPNSRTFLRDELDSHFQPEPLDGYARAVIHDCHRTANTETHDEGPRQTELGPSDTILNTDHDSSDETIITGPNYYTQPSAPPQLPSQRKKTKLRRSRPTSQLHVQQSRDGSSGAKSATELRRPSRKAAQVAKTNNCAKTMYNAFLCCIKLETYIIYSAFLHTALYYLILQLLRDSILKFLHARQGNLAVTSLQ